jgi:SOS response regulatory protein OraA/RecX
VRRLSESALYERLLKKGYGDDEVREAITFCKQERYLDDALFARLYVEGTRKAVGDARLVGELVRRGIDRETACRTVASAETGEDARLLSALEKLMRTRPGMSYPSAARALERLGFPAASIYRCLRAAAERGNLFEGIGASGETLEESSIAAASAG